jgi:hypothetical protein
MEPKVPPELGWVHRTHYRRLPVRCGMAAPALGPEPRWGRLFLTLAEGELGQRFTQ